MRFFIALLPLVSSSNPCLEADLPAHAFEIATTCALLDTVNLPTDANITGTVACISQFAHGSSDYGYEMYNLFVNSPDSNCAQAILGYEARVLDQRTNTACGMLSSNPNPWTAADLPASLDISLCLYLLSSSLEYFFYMNDFDIRKDLTQVAACGVLPSNAFDIAATSFLFDEINFPMFVNVTAANMLASVSRFAHASSEYGEAMYTLFYSAPNDCQAAILKFGKKLIGERGGTACGVGPTGLSGLASGDIPLALGGLDCLNVLAPSLEAFMATNGIDLRGISTTMCPAAAINAFEGTYDTLQVIHGCLISQVATMANCVTGSMSTDFTNLPDTCQDLYEALYTSLGVVQFGVATCTSEVYSDTCLLEIAGPLQDFVQNSGGNTLGVTPPDVCVPGVDDFAEYMYQPFLGLLEALQYNGIFSLELWVYGYSTGTDAIYLSSCRRCYDIFVSGLVNSNRNARLESLCGAPSFEYLLEDKMDAYDEMAPGCIKFLLEAGNPLSDFYKCAKFPMTVVETFDELPQCFESDQGKWASLWAFIPVIECLTDGEGYWYDLYYVSESESLTAFFNFTDPASCANALGIDRAALSTPCLACHDRLLMGIYDTITRNFGTLFTCLTDAYDIACLFSLYIPLVTYDECVAYQVDFTQISMESCSVPTDGSQAKFDYAVGLAFNLVMLENMGYSDLIADPRYPFTSEVPCHRCFEGFMSLLAEFTVETIEGEPQHACEVVRNSPRCYLEASKAINMFELCSNLTISRLPELGISVLAPTCEVEWPGAMLIDYRYFAPLVRMVMDDIVELPLNISIPSHVSVCEGCVRQFVTDVATLNSDNYLLSVVCDNEYSQNCVGALESVFTRFGECSGNATLLSGSPNEYSPQLFQNLTSSGLANYIIYDIGLGGEPNPFTAVYMLESVFSAAVLDEVFTADQVDLARPCLVDLVESLATMPPSYRATCFNDYDSFACGIRVGEVMSKFESCSGGFLTLTTPTTAATIFGEVVAATTTVAAETSTATTASSKSSATLLSSALFVAMLAMN